MAIRLHSVGRQVQFWYSPAVPLCEPFSYAAWTGTGASATKFFWGLTIEDTGGLIYTLDYQGQATNQWTGELAKVKIPYGGYVRLDMGTTTYNASRQVREVTALIHSKNGTPATEKRYEIRHESGTSALSQHTLTQVNEPDNSPAPARKEWVFGVGAGVSGMVLQHNVYTMPAGTNLANQPSGANKFRVETTWTNDGSMTTPPYGKPYISATVTTNDLGQTYSATKRVTQVQDVWGNLTSMTLHNFGAPGSGTWGAARRVYTNEYLGSWSGQGAYVSAYIRNRLLRTTYSENNGSIRRDVIPAG